MYWQVVLLGIAAAVAVVILGVAVLMPPAPPTPPQLYIKVVPSGGSYLLYVNDSKALREVWYSRNGGPLLKADGPIRVGCGDRVEVVALYADGSRQSAAAVVKCSAPFKVPGGGVRLGDTARAALKAVEELEYALRGKPVTLVTESISCRPGEQLQIRVRVVTPGGHYSPPALGCVGPNDSAADAICFDNTGFTLKTWGAPTQPLQPSYLYIPLTLTYYAPAYAAGSDYLGQNNYTGWLVVERLGCGPTDSGCYYTVYWFDGASKQALGKCGWWLSGQYKLIEQPKDVKKPLTVVKLPAKTDWTIIVQDGEVYVNGVPLVYKGSDGKYYVNQELLKLLTEGGGTAETPFDKVEGNMGDFAGSVFLTLALDPQTGEVDPKTGVGYEITVTGAGQLYQGGGNAFAYLGTKDGKVGVIAGDWLKFGISPWSTVEVGVIKLLLQMPLDQKICLAADCSAVKYVKNVADFRVDRVTLRYWGLVGGIHTFVSGGVASGMGYGVEVPGLYLAAVYYNATAPLQTAPSAAQTAVQATTTTTTSTTTLTTTTPSGRR